MSTRPNYAPLWSWIKERESIRVLKESGSLPPWTSDPILAKYRFCNVRREDDRVTIWIRKNIREPFVKHPFLWLMLCIARQINWPPTLLELIEMNVWPSDKAFNPRHITGVLNDRKDRGEKVYTGAYMISAPHQKGSDKQAYIAETVIGDLWRRRHGFVDFFNVFYETGSEPTLQEAHKNIMLSKGWGQFMAYQAVVDMRFTKLLRNAPDRLNWAAAGPGTLRGLNRLHAREVNVPLSQEQALKEMRVIYDVVQEQTRVKMDFSDVPNILCEHDKYQRVLLGQGTPRALYVPGRGC